MYTREEVKLMSAGDYALKNASIDKQSLLLYVEASVAAYDLIMKKLLDEKKKEQKQEEQQ